MRYRTIGWISVTALLLSGCATSMGSKAQESEALKTQVASLEGRVEDLNQRLEELLQRQSTLEAQPQTLPADSSEPIGSKKGVALSNKQIQSALKTAGFYNGPIDGKLGPKTKEAVRDFQRSQGLHPDGVVGSKTSAALATVLENRQPKE